LENFGQGSRKYVFLIALLKIGFPSSIINLFDSYGEYMADKSENRKSFIFVLMPFDRRKFLNIYILGIKGACEEAGCICERVDEQYVSGNKIILHQVFEQIEKADIIIADMSGLNPNVFYEVGFAHAYKKDMILLTQNDDEIPFDLKPFQYETYSADNIPELKEKLIKKVKWIISKKLSEKKLSLFHSKAEENDIKKYLNEIEIYRGRKDKETLYKNVDNIKRLIKLNQKNLPLYDCYLRSAYFLRTNLQNANLLRSNLQGANLEGAILTMAVLQRADLRGANLREANLQKSNLKEANLARANLYKAGLHGADLNLANLEGANLQRSDLWEVNLEGANLQGANLQGAELVWANLQGVRGLNVEMLIKVNTLYQVTGLDHEVMNNLNKQKPELFQKPKNEN
jgi:nucleoside 2-deoxyribosyltransferase